MTDQMRQINDLLEGSQTEPELYLGARRGKEFEVVHVPLGRDASSALVDTARDFIASSMDNADREYDPRSELERGEEYFRLTLNAIVAAKHESSEPVSTPSVIAFLDALENLDHAQPYNPDHAFSSILFYVIRFESGPNVVHLIKKQDPTRTMRNARQAFILGSALELTAKPNFVLADSFDLALHDGELLIWVKSAFEQLVSDARVDLLEVAKRTREVSGALAGTVPLDGAAQEAVEAACSSRLTYARRLASLPERIAAANLTPERVRQALERHGEDASLFLQGDMFSFTVDYVPAFLDIVEGRWFEDDFTSEKRRADRLSRRG